MTAVRASCPAILLALVLLVPVRAAAPAGAVQDPGCFGSAVAVPGDIDGDGVPDLAVGDAAAAPGGCVSLFSGKDGTLIRTIAGARGEGFGAAVAPAGDLDGDGKPDLAVGAPYAEPGGVLRAGLVRICSGADGRTLREFRAAEEFAKLGRTLAAIGDIDGDGAADFAAGAPGAKPGGKNGAGEVRLLSGGTGRVLWTAGGNLPFEGFGLTVAAAGDADGDGVRDVAAGSPFEGSGGLVRVLSGKTGAPLRTLSFGVQNALFGMSLASPGDIDGDGRPDLAVGAPMAFIKDRGAVGVVRVHGGKDGRELASWPGGAPLEEPGLGLAAPGDMDGDRVPDLWVAAAGAGKGAGPVGRIDLVSGKDGTVLRTIRSTRPGEMLGTAMAIPGDMDGDGAPDLLAGAPGATRAYLFSGKDGKLLREMAPR